MILLIKADNRPKKCGECKGWYKCEGWEKEPYTCPIIGEIADDHGRLIDADKLKENLKGKIIRVVVDGYDGTVIAVKDVEISDFFYLIDEAPTVMEANHEH